MSSPSTLETAIKPFDLHVLVCTNTRVAPAALPGETPLPPKASCGPLGAENVRAELKTWLHTELKNHPRLIGKVRVRVNGSGCLDFCKKGIVVAIYPQSEFLFFVKNTEDSIAAVKAQLVTKLNELEEKSELEK